jgi:hypothetical protein
MAEGPNFIALNVLAREIGEADVLKVGAGRAQFNE